MKYVLIFCAILGLVFAYNYYTENYRYINFILNENVIINSGYGMPEHSLGYRGLYITFTQKYPMKISNQRCTVNRVLMIFDFNRFDLKFSKCTYYYDLKTT